MGAASVLGKDMVSELIKSFPKLAAATEKVPHPGWSDVHPLLLPGMLQRPRDSWCIPGRRQWLGS